MNEHTVPPCFFLPIFCDFLFAFLHDGSQLPRDKFHRPLKIANFKRSMNFVPRELTSILKGIEKEKSRVASPCSLPIHLTAN